MKLLSNYRSLLVLAALLVCAPNALAAQAKGKFEQTISIDGPIQLDVATSSGSITIRAGQADRVEVTGHIVVKRKFGRSTEDAEEMVRQLEAEPPVEFSGGLLQIGHIKDRKFKRNVVVSYEIVVPAEIEVTSHTGSGSQEISGVRGPVNVRTGSGALTLNDIGGNVDAHTGSGRIRAEGIAGAFEGYTGSGSIRLVQVAPGDVVVHTGSGASDLSGIDGALDAHAGSGSITVEGRQVGPWKLKTGSGSVKIRLPEDAAMDIDAETNSGDIYTGHPITLQGRISEDHLSGKIRGGGALLLVRTGSGDIRID